MTTLTESAASPLPQHPHPPDAATVAAMASLRRNHEITAVIIVTPTSSSGMHDCLTIMRLDATPLLPKPADGSAAFHVPHWATTLLTATEGAR